MSFVLALSAQSQGADEYASARVVFVSNGGAGIDLNVHFPIHGREHIVSMARALFPGLETFLGQDLGIREKDGTSAGATLRQGILNEVFADKVGGLFVAQIIVGRVVGSLVRPHVALALDSHIAVKGELFGSGVGAGFQAFVENQGPQVIFPAGIVEAI